MAEGRCPQVFVVDPPTPWALTPNEQRVTWRRAKASLLWFLFGLTVLGLGLEGVFIHRLYQRTEVLHQYLSQNQSNSRSAASDVLIMGQRANLVSNEVLQHPEELRERPMAHLQGSIHDCRDGVVQWVKNSDAFTHDMDYNSSGLVVKTEGYYYLYSKLHLQEIEDCVMVNHKVIRNTTKYGLPIELMKAQSLHCRNERPNRKNVKREMDLWNSFLGGVFKLAAGDHVFVTLDKGLYPGPADNFFGAFMMT